MIPLLTLIQTHDSAWKLWRLTLISLAAGTVVTSLKVVAVCVMSTGTDTQATLIYILTLRHVLYKPLKAVARASCTTTTCVTSSILRAVLVQSAAALHPRHTPSCVIASVSRGAGTMVTCQGLHAGGILTTNILTTIVHFKARFNWWISFITFNARTGEAAQRIRALGMFSTNIFLVCALINISAGGRGRITRVPILTRTDIAAVRVVTVGIIPAQHLVTFTFVLIRW